MTSEPGTAASASSIDGSPVRIPTCVADRSSPSWMSGISGGTARTVRRSAFPVSQSRTSGTSVRPVVGAERKADV
jgi:hypothetical protein